MEVNIAETIANQDNKMLVTCAFFPLWCKSMAISKEHGYNK